MCVLAGLGWGGAAPQEQAVSDLPPGRAALRPPSPQLFTWRRAHLTLLAFEESKAQKPQDRTEPGVRSCLQ